MSVHKYLIVFAAGAMWASHALAQNRFELHTDQAQLVVGDETFNPIEVITPWHDFHEVDGRLFYTQGVSVVEVARDYSTVINTAVYREGGAPAGVDLVWLGHAEGIVILAERREEAGPDLWDLHPAPAIRRLDLKTFEWLESWDMELGDLTTEQIFDSTRRNIHDEEPKHLLAEVLADDHSVYVLTMEVVELESAGERVLSYQVAAFAPDGKTPRWTRRFLTRDSAGTPIRSTPLYTEDLDGDYRTTLTPLTLIEPGEYSDDPTMLLVCGGPTEDLLWLNAKSGAELDRLRALWEFEPGEYVVGEVAGDITRFAVDPDVDGLTEPPADPATSQRADVKLRDLSDDDWRKIDTYRLRRDRFYADFDTRIVAGPMFVPTAESTRFGDSGEPVLTVIVERRRKSTDASYEHDSETILYHLDNRYVEGRYEVRDFLKLPMVTPYTRLRRYPHTPQLINDGILWWSRDAWIARIDVENFSLDWFRGNPTGIDRGEYNDPPHTPAACSQTMMFRAHGFRSWNRPKESVTFRIDAILLADGSAAEFALRIPVSNPFEQRASLEISAIETDGRSISFVVASRRPARLTFELPPGLHD